MGEDYELRRVRDYIENLSEGNYKTKLKTLNFQSVQELLLFMIYDNLNVIQDNVDDIRRQS